MKKIYNNGHLDKQYEFHKNEFPGHLEHSLLEGPLHVRQLLLHNEHKKE